MEMKPSNDDNVQDRSNFHSDVRGYGSGHIWDESDGLSNSESTKERQPKCKQYRGKFRLNRRMETSDSSGESDSSDSSSTDTSAGYIRGSRKSYVREVVVPPVFETDGPVSLSKYLEGYERYFQAKYWGGQRECSQELGRFLTGDAKEAYDILGGPHVKYRDIKPKLLDWFKSQRVGRKEQHRQTFEQVIMHSAESLKLYCMRVEELVRRAFPNDSKRQSQEAKRKIEETAPLGFLELIEKKKEVKRMLNIGKSVSWREISEMAGEWDRTQKRGKRRCDNLNVRYDKLLGVSAVQKKGDEVRNDAQPLAPGETCLYCNKPGHQLSECWLRLGKCLL